MKNLMRGILVFVVLAGTATTSEAGPICALLGKIAECPSVRKLKAECRAKKAAKKMKAKKPLCACLKDLFHHDDCCCDDECDCNAEPDCDCQR